MSGSFNVNENLFLCHLLCHHFPFLMISKKQKPLQTSTNLWNSSWKPRQGRAYSRHGWESHPWLEKCLHITQYGTAVAPESEELTVAPQPAELRVAPQSRELRTEPAELADMLVLLCLILTSLTISVATDLQRWQHPNLFIYQARL